MTYIIWKLYDSRDENISLISIRYKCMTRRTTPRDCYCSFWRRPLTNNHLGKLWKTVRPVTRNRIFATTRFLTENLSSVGRMHSEHRVKWDVTIQWLYPSIPPTRRCMYTLKLIKRIPPSTCPKPPKTQRKHEQSQRVTNARQAVIFLYIRVNAWYMFWCIAFVSRFG